MEQSADKCGNGVYFLILDRVCLGGLELRFVNEKRVSMCRPYISMVMIYRYLQKLLRIVAIRSNTILD